MNYSSFFLPASTSKYACVGLHQQKLMVRKMSNPFRQLNLIRLGVGQYFLKLRRGWTIFFFVKMGGYIFLLLRWGAIFFVVKMVDVIGKLFSVWLILGELILLCIKLLHNLIFGLTGYNINFLFI